MTMRTKNYRIYRSTSALEFSIKIGEPERDRDGKITEWPDGNVFLNFFTRADMKAPVDRDSKLTMMLSNIETFSIINNYRKKEIGNELKIIHKNPHDNNSVKSILCVWYQKNEGSNPLYYCNISAGEDRRISVTLNAEDIQMLEMLNKICVEKTYVAA